MANALAPLMYQPAQPAEYYARGQEQGNALQQRQALQQYGPGAIQGNQNALGEIARFDPTMSMGLINTQSGMADRDKRTGIMERDANERLTILKEQARQQTEAHAANMSAADIENTQKQMKMLGALAQAQSPEEWDFANEQLKLPYGGQFDKRDELMALYEGVAEALGGGDATAAVQTLKQRAKLGGLVEGTAEYQDYMRNGGVERTQDVGPTFRPMTTQELETYRAPPGSQIDEKTGKAYPAETRDTTTEGERKAGGFLLRMEYAEEQINKLSESAQRLNYAQQGALGLGVPESWVTSGDEQRARQFQIDWVRAKLRLESGAVIGDDEALEEANTYFPRPGDGPERIKAKEESRKQALEQVRMMAGREGGDAKGLKIADDIPEIPPEILEILKDSPVGTIIQGENGERLEWDGKQLNSL